MRFYEDIISLKYDKSLFEFGVVIITDGFINGRKSWWVCGNAERGFLRTSSRPISLLTRPMMAIVEKSKTDTHNILDELHTHKHI